MIFRVEPLNRPHAHGTSGELAARVVGLDLRQSMEDATFERLLQAHAQFPVLIFEDQFLDDDQQIAFTKKFGVPEETYGVFSDRIKRTRLKRTDFADISNLDDKDEIVQDGDERRYFALSNRVWHVDKTFHEIPSRVGILTAKEVPSRGGGTEFADMRAAWDALSDEEKHRLRGLSVVHDTLWSRGRLGVKFSEEEAKRLTPVTQPILRTSARTGRTNLYLSSHSHHIVGWPKQEGRDFIERLTAHATQPRFCYVHHWKVGDVLLWDQRCTMHRAADDFDEFKERRVLARTAVKELERPSESVAFA
ncbi:TauD/TfdA dioxygenase family protein [Ramlibacter sp.]|uniref:TauD/TfdA dioxygenase family protein n=1 Tax=Ramlibacter sp. TaxID=1917967 RepID=UPI003D0AC635